jgi:hypothetical protein
MGHGGGIPMSDRSNTTRGTAGKILLGFALLVSLVAVITIDDRLQRDSLEEFGLPTGLGDDEIYDLEGVVYNPLEPIFKLDGTDIYRRRRKPSNRADDEMMKVARDDGDRIYFYEEAKHLFKGTEAPEGIAGEGIYFVKVGDDLYLEVGNSKLDLPEDEGSDPPTTP